MSEQDAAPPAGRRRLNLKPRDPQAAAHLEAERQKSLGAKNPFGAAKPREAVIAEKTGKTEEEVLKEELSKDKLHLRLSGPQLDEKREAEAALKDLQDQLEVEEDAGRKAEIGAELVACQQKMDDLMADFAKVTLEQALSGGAPRVSQIREQQLRQQEATGMAGGPGAAGSYGQRYNPTQQYGGGQGGGGGGSFGGREFSDGGFGGGRGGGGGFQQGGGGGGGGRGGGGGFQQGAGGAGGAPGGGGGRGFKDYQQRGGYSDNYQQGGGDRQGGGSYGGRKQGGGRLPEWAVDEPSADAGFYDAPAATSAFIASGGYQGAAGGAPGGGRGRGGGRGGGSGARGLGGEFEYSEGDASFGAGQDRF